MPLGKLPHLRPAKHCVLIATPAVQGDDQRKGLLAVIFFRYIDAVGKYLVGFFEQVMPFLVAGGAGERIAALFDLGEEF